MNLLEEARAVISEGPICDGCLGRRFAELSYGLTSRERGNGLRVAVAMEDDEPYEEVPPEECWVCDGAFAGFEEWAERAASAVEGYEFETFLVGTRVPPLVEENESLLGNIHGTNTPLPSRLSSTVRSRRHACPPPSRGKRKPPG